VEPDREKIQNFLHTASAGTENVSLRSSLLISFIFFRAMANPNTTTPEIQEISNRILQKENEITEKEEQVLRLRRQITENTQGDWRRTDLHVSYIHNFHR
jgi:hypothetical protein